jgi:hypothetical protein
MSFQRCRKFFKWAFVLTLPLTILPIINGIVCGLYYVHWKDTNIDNNVDAYLYGLKDISNDWGFRDFTFRDFQDKDNKLHLVRLNSNDWVQKLGFVLPREYGDWDYNQNTPVNKLNSLDALMFDTQYWRNCAPPPKEQWVYVANSDWMLWEPWDPAFNSVVQAAYVPSHLNKTKLHFLGCWGTAKFLCGVWGVRSPTLLHFLVEDEPPNEEDIDAGLHYSRDLEHLRPVTVRVVEFPLQDAYTGLPTDVFPGHKEQMLAIMSGDRLYEQFEPWNELEQESTRLNEYMEELSLRKGTFLYYSYKAEDWMVDHVAKPLYLDTALNFVSSGVFVVTALLGSLIWRPLHWAKQTVLDFLGYPRRGDWIFADGSSTGWNIIEGWLGGGQGMWDSFAKHLGKANLEKNWPGGQITTSSFTGTTPVFEGATSITGATTILDTAAVTTA